MKKIPILSVAEILTGQMLAPLGGQAFARDITSVRANEKATDFVFKEIGGVSGNIGFEYNETQRQDITLSEVYIATYKYEEYTTAMIEERLGELGTDRVNDPEWADLVVLSAVPIDYGMIGSRTIFTSGWSNFVNNRPGILYYALKIYEVENPDEPVWYRGKIDYRACIRDVETGAKYNCTGRASEDGTMMEFVREGTEDAGLENVKTWGEEWQEELIGQLEAMDAELEKWTGGDSEKVSWEDKLAYIERMSTDAADIEVVRQKITSVREAIAQKEWNLEHPEEKDEETMVKPGAGGEVTLPPSGALGGNSSSSTGPSGALGGGSGSLTQSSGNETVSAKTPEQEEMKISTVIATVVPEARRTEGALTQKPNDESNNEDELNDGEEGDEIAEDEKVSNDYDVEVVVPNLNEEAVLVSRWWFWLLIGLILTLGGVVYWWCKRAFGRKSNK